MRGGPEGLGTKEMTTGGVAASTEEGVDVAVKVATDSEAESELGVREVGVGAEVALVPLCTNQPRVAIRDGERDRVAGGLLL